MKTSNNNVANAMSDITPYPPEQPSLIAQEPLILTPKSIRKDSKDTETPFMPLKPLTHGNVSELALKKEAMTDAVSELELNKEEMMDKPVSFESLWSFFSVTSSALELESSSYQLEFSSDDAIEPNHLRNSGNQPCSSTSLADLTHDEFEDYQEQEDFALQMAIYNSMDMLDDFEDDQIDELNIAAAIQQSILSQIREQQRIREYQLAQGYQNQRKSIKGKERMV